MKSKNHRRVAALVAAGVLLVACGDEADDGVPATAGISPSSTAPSNDDTEAIDPPMPATSSEATPAADPPVATDGAAEAAASDAPAGSDPQAEAPPVTEQATVQPAVLGGRALTEALTAESDIETNMLPDLIVDDVGREAKINLRNVFPADRPVLIWMWAPH